MSKYDPPIAVARFKAMLVALNKHKCEGAPLSDDMVAEICDALYKLLHIYQAELRKGLGRAVATETWQAAAVALFLIDYQKVRPQAAYWASIDDPAQREDPKAVARVKRAVEKLRSGKVSPLVVSELQLPNAVLLQAAIGRLKRKIPPR